jgi:LacI family transcriptional regulator
LAREKKIAAHHSPRLKDVAELSGVHLSTVSRALNLQTAAMVSPETAKRVHQAAKKLGYMVDGVARALKTRHSMSIGIMIPDITNPFFPPAVRGAEEVLAASGYSVILSSTNNDVHTAQTQFKAMIQARVDGLLIGMIQRKDPIVKTLRSSGIATVLFNRTIDGSEFSSVVPDDAYGSELAVEHLHALGHRKIGLAIGPVFTSTADSRLRAVRKSVKKRGMTCQVVEAVGFDETAGRIAMEQILHDLPEVTAVIAGNDLIAIGVIDAIRAAGMECPGDISVVGFNNMPLAGRLNPPLTTINVPEYELGRLAALSLLRLMSDPKQRRECQVIPVNLIVRDSTAVARRTSPRTKVKLV